MKGLKYQMKSVLRDKFCLMTFLLPILVAVALHFMGSIDMSSLGELHFGVLENELSPQTVTWLKRYGPVTAYGTQEELTAAINEPSTNVIGVRADGDSLKTAISGDELDIFRRPRRCPSSMSGGKRRARWKSRHWSALTSWKICKAFLSRLC